MSLVMQRETTEYIYVGITGSVPSVGAEITFLAAGTRPQEVDWETATIVDSDVHALWEDATGSGASGDYYVARLVGPYNANDVNPGVGDYQVWLRLTDTDEQPVRIAPVALEIQ